MKLLEKIHTDQRYYSLVAYGVEGSNYNLVDGKISFDGIEPGRRFAWTAVADDAMNYDAFPVNEKWYEEVYYPVTEWSEEVVMTAEDDPLDEFTILPSGREQDAVSQVWLQYFQPLVCGYGEDYRKNLDMANERLREMGFDRYLLSIQKQLTEYADGVMEGMGM